MQDSDRTIRTEPVVICSTNARRSDIVSEFAHLHQAGGHPQGNEGSATPSCDDAPRMPGSELATDLDSREARRRWLQGEPFTRAGLHVGVSEHAFRNLWPRPAGLPPR